MDGFKSRLKDSIRLRLSLWLSLAILAIALVAVLQWRTRNALLSILVGTAAYVLMRNFAFA